jgi:hypothetical protein
MRRTTRVALEAVPSTTGEMSASLGPVIRLRARALPNTVSQKSKLMPD